MAKGTDMIVDSMPEHEDLNADDLGPFILVCGGTGLVGKALVADLVDAGRPVVVWTRRQALPHDPGVLYQRWTEDDAPPSLPWDRCRGIVNLVGENLAAKRWSTSRKKVLRHSRIAITKILARLAAEHGVPVLVNASAIGIYAASDEACSEDSEVGSSFLAQLVQDWEAATDLASKHDCRTVLLRLAPVLDRKAGALREIMRQPVLAILGSGKQAFPWIHLDDCVAIIRRALDDPDWSGPINVAAPAHTTHAELIKGIAAHTGRWRFPINAPAFVLRLVLGEMASMLLTGNDISVNRLQELGFEWEYDDLDGCLSQLLN